MMPRSRRTIKKPHKVNLMSKIDLIHKLENTVESVLNQKIAFLYGKNKEMELNTASKFIYGRAMAIENKRINSMPDYMAQISCYDIYSHDGFSRNAWVELKVWDGRLTDKVHLRHLTAGQRQWLRNGAMVDMVPSYVLLRLNSYLILVPGPLVDIILPPDAENCYDAKTLILWAKENKRVWTYAFPDHGTFLYGLHTGRCYDPYVNNYDWKTQPDKDKFMTETKKMMSILEHKRSSIKDTGVI